MKATLHRDTLVKCSERILPFIDKKPIVPVYGCYLLHFESGWLHLTATDGVSQATVSCHMSCEEEVSMCVDAIKFHEIIKHFSDPEVKLSIKGTGANGSLQKLVIKSGNGKHELPMTSAGDFPVVKKPEQKSFVALDLVVLTSIFNAVSALVNGKDDHTPQMTGIHIVAHPEVPGKLSFEGGTAFRSAIATMAVDNAVYASWQPIIIPKAVTSRIKDVFSGSGDIHISHDGQRCLISDGHSKISTRGLEGKFAKMTMVLLSTIKTIHASPDKGVIAFSCGESLDAIKRLRVHKTENVSTMAIEVSGKSAEMTIENRDTATYGNESITISGNPSAMKLGMHIDMLEDCIRVANAPSIELSYCAPQKFYVFAPLHGVQQDYNLSILLSPSSL